MKQIALPALPKKILLSVGLLLLVAYLIACFSAYIHPAQFYGITYFALAFPLLLIAMIIWCILASWVFPRKGWLFFLLLLPGWFNVSNIIAFNKRDSFSSEKKPTHIRVLSWNVNEFLSGHIYDSRWKEKQLKMLEFVGKSQADILCFQDFAQSANKESIDVLNYITDSLHYRYRYFSMDGVGYGTVIYSLHPIVDSGRIKYKEKVYPESLAYADVVFKDRKIRIFNTHLRSMYLHSSAITPFDIGYPEFVKEDTAFLFHSTRWERLEYFDRIHTSQATLVKAALQQCKLPLIFCADLNAVPASYVYNYISEGLQDAFLEKGNGICGTYKKLTPFLRIDVILTNDQLKTAQFHSPRLKLSDHFPILSDFELSN